VIVFSAFTAQKPSDPGKDCEIFPQNGPFSPCERSQNKV